MRLLKKGCHLKKLNLILALTMVCSVSLFAKTTNKGFNLLSKSSEFVSWGVDPKLTNTSVNLINVKKFYSPKNKKDVVIAVIDTGIDPNHPFLKDNIYRFKGSKNTSSKFGVDYSNKGTQAFTPYDSHGHGTHVSGIIKSVFPDVKLLALKYYNPNASGQANLNSTIKALKYAVDHNVQIINYSGGGPEASEQELMILKKAERKGILVVAAAGNEREDIDKRRNAYYPASYGLSNIITVAAHDQKGKPLGASNWGKYTVDISAPGYKIKSSIPGGRAGIMSGTSQATAFVTGVAGLIKATFPHLKAKDLKRIIKAAARPSKILAEKCVTGGVLDAVKALKVAKKWNEEKEASEREVANVNLKKKVYLFK